MPMSAFQVCTRLTHLTSQVGHYGYRAYYHLVTATLLLYFTSVLLKRACYYCRIKLAEWCALIIIIILVDLYLGQYVTSALTHLQHLIELEIHVAGWQCVWKSAPRTADVTVTKIAGYVRIRILMNR